MSVSIAFAAGGTGGHLFPALAVADEVRARVPDARLTFIGSTRHLDQTLLASRGLEAIGTSVTTLRGGRSLPATTVRLARSTAQARGVMRARNVGAVVGFGGYPSLPAMLAGATLRLPRIAHEANALDRLGVANRIAARTGAEIWGGFPETGRALGKPVEVAGVPIRREIVALDRAAARGKARGRLGCGADATVVLVVGGSLGAKRINDAAAAMVEAGLPSGTELVWSTGVAHYPDLVSRLSGRAGVHLVPFLDDIATAYAAADVVVSRAGAATVAELEHLGLRAALVPLPIARLGEQERNAASLVARGGARVVADSAFNEPTLRAAIETLLSEPEPEPRTRHASAAGALAARLLDLARNPEASR